MLSRTANSRLRSWRIRAIRKRYFARSRPGSRPQLVPVARRAERIARSTSAGVARATWASVSSVAGIDAGERRPVGRRDLATADEQAVALPDPDDVARFRRRRVLPRDRLPVAEAPAVRRANLVAGDGGGGRRLRLGLGRHRRAIMAPGPEPPDASPGRRRSRRSARCRTAARVYSPTMSPAEGDASYERRIVSVLFADLVGFTSLAERLDAEDVAAIQDRYFAAVRETVARHRGVLEKFIGDAAMAAFGVPVGRDDDAERAVRCGLAIAAAVERLHGELGLDPGDLAVRVGIATGEVVHAEDGPDAGRLTGDTVNTAARLQAAARPGGILISETTALAVADTIELGPPAELELKGKAAPVSAREATGVLAIRSRETAMGALRAPILGRETELGTLAAAVARSVTQRRSERWLIVAPPGTGKTRLVDELAGRVQADVLVRRVRFRLDDPRPFGAIADLAGDVVDADIAGRLETGGLTRGRAAVVAEALVGLAAPAREAGDGPTAGGRGTTGGSGPADRDRLFEAWLDGFAALAAPTGELWIAEDGHWASPDALAFIDAASGGPVPSGRLVVVTARPSLLETGRGWATTDPAAGRYRLDLAGLSARSAEALVRALVGDALGDPLVTRIAEASDGNCLYVEELLRSWASSGMLRQGAGGWTFVTSDGPLAIPATVHALYGVQLDDLPPLARATARRAAVAGRRFPVDALPGLGVTDPVTALASLDRRSLIAGPTPAPVVGATYAYRHALLRDAAYVSLARAERAILHVALAGWLEQVAGAAFAVPLVLALDFTASLVLGGTNRKKAVWGEIKVLLPFGMVGACIGAYALLTLPTTPVLLTLGAFTMFFGFRNIFGLQPTGQLPRSWAIPAGLAGGGAGALFGTGGPPYIMYLTRRLLDKGEVRATFSWLFALEGGFRLSLFLFAGLLFDPKLQIAYGLGLLPWRSGSTPATRCTWT